MKKFKEFIDNNEELNKNAIKLIEVWYFSEYGRNELNESVFQDLKSLLVKFGIKTKNNQKGLIQIFAKASKNVGLLLYYAFKVATGDDSYKDKLKEIANTKITKHDVLDVLLKLDVLTLHMLSEPVHIIDAITGWNIFDEVKQRLKNVDEKAKEAIKHLLGLHKSIKNDTDTQKQLKDIIDKIKSLFLLNKQTS